MNYAADGLSFVQQPVAAARPGRLEDVVESNIISSLGEIKKIQAHLKLLVLRSMSTAHHRKWASLLSLLVKMLLEPQVGLKLLWLVEGNPGRANLCRSRTAAAEIGKVHLNSCAA